MKKRIVALFSVGILVFLVSACGGKKQETMLVGADGTYNGISWTTTPSEIEGLIQGYTWKEYRTESGELTGRDYYSELLTGQVAEDKNVRCEITYIFNEDSYGGIFKTGLLSSWRVSYYSSDSGSIEKIRGLWETRFNELFGNSSKSEFGSDEWERVDYTLRISQLDVPDAVENTLFVEGQYIHIAE